MQTVPITTSAVSSNFHTGEFVLNTTPKCKKKEAIASTPYMCATPVTYTSSKHNRTMRDVCYNMMMLSHLVQHTET